MSVKFPKILWGIPIVIATAVVLNFVLDNSNVETFTSFQSDMPRSANMSKESFEDIVSNKLYSGPFAILDATYGVDDTVFLIGSEIPINSKGEIVITRPDGKISHKLFFDGSKSAVNHYFTPVRLSDVEECKHCKLFGIWTISFRSETGVSYDPIYFEVVDSQD